MLLGPTGCGKTHLAQTLARLLNVPFAVADATALTEAGYVGEDVENILLKLIQAADFDVKKAETGIIYIDEIDKIARKSENPSITRDVSRRGRAAGAAEDPRGHQSPRCRRRAGASTRTRSSSRSTPRTSCSSAVARSPGWSRSSRAASATRASASTARCAAKAERDPGELFAQVLPEDLLKFGLIPEFVGRLPMIGAVRSLDREALVRILTEPKNALVKQYQQGVRVRGRRARVHRARRSRRSPTRRCCAAPAPAACGRSSKRCCSTRCTTCPAAPTSAGSSIDVDTVRDEGQPDARAPRAARPSGRAARPADRVVTPTWTLRRRARATSTRTSTTSKTGRIDVADRSSGCSRIVAAMGDPQLAVPGDPHHRHERQGLDGADDHPPADGARPHGRHLHQPAPRADQRAHQPRRRADQRRRLRRADRRGRRHRGARRRAAVVLRDRHRGGVPLVRRRRRRRRGGRGRPARPLGRHQRRATPRSPSSPTSGCDHTEYAGPTTADIAREKAGIIKPGSAVGASARPTPSSSTVLPPSAGARACSCAARTSTCVDNQLALGGRLVDLRTPTTVYPEVFVPLHGAHQGDNAAVALTAVEAFFAAPRRDGHRRRGLRRGDDAGPVRGGRPPAAGDHRRRPQPGRRRRRARRCSSTTSIRRAGAILVVGCLQGRDPSEMLSALRADEFDVVLTCTAAVAAWDAGGASWPRRPGARAATRSSSADTVERACDRAVRTRRAATTPSWWPARSTSSAPPAPSSAASCRPRRSGDEL